MKTLHDQHEHTKYSLDAKVDVETYYQMAVNAGCEYYVSTDHIEFNSVYNHQDWTVDYEALKKDLDQMAKKYPSCKPLLGVEVGYRKDSITRMDTLIKSQTFDIVNMSIHDNGVYDYYMQRDYKEIGIDKMLDIYFNNAIDGVKSYFDYDVFSHVDYGFKTAKLIDSSICINTYEKYLTVIFKEIIKQDKVLEINFKVQETIDQIPGVIRFEHLKQLLTIYKNVGGKKLSFSSDAHTKEQLESYYVLQSSYFKVFKEMGFNELYYFIKRIPYTYQI